jgi:DNA replication and repair protein RecF
VQIEWVQLIDHRSYRALSYSPVKHLNVLTGANGQGKSNLLEALGLLLVGRSFRGAKAAEMVRWGADGALVTGSIRRGGSTRVLRREIRRREDGGWVVTGEGCEWARVVPFSWFDLGIVNGSPQARRNFVDGFAGKIQPAHLSTLVRYRQVLSRRNALIQARLSRTDLDDRLGPWDEQIARLGIEMVERRRAAVVTLGQEIERLWSDLSRGVIHLEYRSSLGPEPSVASVMEQMSRRRGEEIRRGQTLVGPHRDDLAIEMDGRDMRQYGSRGQQRLLALALRLAEVAPVSRAVGSPPVLVLDDAMSELDPRTQRAVFEMIAGHGQVFLTTADAVLAAPEAAWWVVLDSAIEPQVARAEAVLA